MHTSAPSRMAPVSLWDKTKIFFNVWKKIADNKLLIIKGGEVLMKKLMTKLWKDESAQGATEYILMLVIVVGIAVMFKNQIKDIIGNKISQLAGDISAFN